LTFYYSYVILLKIIYGGAPVTEKTKEDFELSNIAIRTMLEGVEIIIGKNGLKTVLHSAGLSRYIDNLPPANMEMSDARISDCGRYENAIREIFGNNGARAILFNVGRGQAQAGINENPELAEATLKAFEGMPDKDRVRIVLSTAAAGASAQIGNTITLTENGESFLYEEKPCTHCFQMTADTPVCHPIAGFVYELIRWATGKESYDVTQITCAAMGDPSCIIKVSPRQ
jgi:predicted hydrocarbon binding protein